VLAKLKEEKEKGNAVDAGLLRGSKTTVTRKAVLCYLFKGNAALLQLKSKDKFGAGYWNAPGGKIEEGESPEAAAAREVYEETGLAVNSLRLHGELLFVFEEDEEYNQQVFVFSSNDFSGSEKPSEEGILRWFDKDKLPFDAMWPDDKKWLPLLLDNKRFRGEFYFDSYKNKKLLRYKLEEI